MVVHDLRPVPEHGLERVLGALLALRAARPHLLLLPRQQDRVGLRVRDITQADAAQEMRQTPVVPELRRVAIATTPTTTTMLVTTGGRAVPGGVPRVLREFCELLVDGRQHALEHNAAWRIRDAEEEVRKLERRQGEPPALLFELTRLAGDKFLRFGVEPESRRPKIVHENARRAAEGRRWQAMCRASTRRRASAMRKEVAQGVRCGALADSSVQEGQTHDLPRREWTCRRYVFVALGPSP